MIKAVIFDMDGVIVDSEHVHNKAEKEAMLKYGVKVSSKELQNYTGMTDEAMFTEFIKEHDLDTTHEEIYNEKEKALLSLLKENITPVAGVINLINKLKQAGIKLGVASSSHRKVVGFVLKELGIASLFDTIIAVEDITHGKPDPEIFLKAASKLSTNPEDCLVIEDARSGVEAAKKAGMKCIGYKNPNSGNQDLSKADIIVDDFSKIKVKELLSV